MNNKSILCMSLKVSTSLVSAAMIFSASGQAQTNAGESSSANGGNASVRANADDIVVTARRRSELAQQVPVAVTALSGEALQERRISSGQDLQGQVPSLAVGPRGQSRDVETISIRGQSSGYQASPAVVQYMAEVPLIPGRSASLQGGPGQFLDLANVQILRGPQGTLFGRNTTGGAALLEPAKPTNRYEGYFQAQFGNYRDREVEGVVNVPVTDALQVRVAGRFVDRKGFTQDVLTGTDYDNRHYYTGRLGILWKPTADIENYLMVSGVRSSSNGTGYSVEAFNAPYIDSTIFGVAGGCAGVGLGANCSVLTALADAQQARGVRKVALGPTSLDTYVHSWSAVDQLTVHLSDQVTLRNIASYSELKALTPFDGDGTQIAYSQGAVNGRPTDNVRQFTEEFQIQADSADSRLQLTTGAYYDRLSTPDTVINSGFSFLFSRGNTSFHYKQTSFAVYGQASYDLGGLVAGLDGLTLTGGARYTWDRTSGAGASFTYAPDGVTVSRCRNGTSPAPTSIEDCELGGTFKSSSPTWTVGLDYKVAKSLMAYGKVSRGYKTGGIGFIAVNASNLFYKPEFVTTYEAGVKTTTNLGPNARLLFNANIFRTDYKDIQVVAGDINLTSFASGAATYNAGKARINGIELEGSLHYDIFDLSANYSHMKARYKEFSIFSPFGGRDCSGGRVVGNLDLTCVPFGQTPKYTYNIAGRVTLPVDESLGKIVLSTVWSYTGPRFVTTTVPANFEPSPVTAGYGLLNISASWSRILQSPFDLSVFMTNATNKVYRVAGTGTYNSLGVQANVYGEPRMYGMTGRFNF